MAPASMVYSGLELTTTGTFATQNNQVTANSAVQVGVNPASGADFVPLLSLDNGVQFMSNDATGTFTTNGTVSGIIGGQTVQLLDAHLHTFKAPALLSNLFFTLASGDTNSAQLSVAGGNVAVTGFRLTSQELDLQGSLTLSKLGGLTLAVQGTDYIKVNSAGVQLTGADVTLPGPISFSKAGLDFTAQNLHVHYSSANNEFDISGQASISVAGNTIGLTLGDNADPGLVIVNGDLQGLNANLALPAGMTTIPFTEKGLSFQISSASLMYDSASATFGIGGSATLSVADQTLTVNLGTDAMPGLVIANGIVSTLDASISTDISVHGLDLKAEDLAIHYADSDPDVTITGKASIEVKGQSVEIALGSTEDNVTHPGIVIDKNTGQLTELDAFITTDLSIGGLTIKADDLAVHYNAGSSGDVMITGTAEFELDDHSVSIMLGDADHPGIDIDGTGTFVSLDAAVTSDITVAGLDIKTDNLGIEYDANNLDIYGSASFELKGQSVGISLGDAMNPGVQIVNGQLASLTASVTTNLDLLGIELTTNNLTVSYMSSPQMIAIYGDVGVTTKFVSFDSTLGTADDPGIEIVDGQLTQLNLTVSGGFSLFGFNVAANGLMITYNGSQLELSGGVMVQLTDSFQIAASISQGGLIIDTNTGALSLDTSHGLDIMGSVTFGSYGIKNLDIGFSNGPNGVNFHASGEVDLPDDIKVSLDELDIKNGQLADIGLTLDAEVPIGDTGFFLDSISGDLENLDNPSQLIVKASVEVSFGKKITIPPVPGIFGGADAAIVDATGSITITPNDLDVSGQVVLLGGLLGQGNATLDLNWTTGVYTVSGGFSMYDGIIGFSGSLTITNAGDINLLATASVNVPGVIPFIGGDNLGNVNIYLQYIPGDVTDSYVSAWTTVNLFVTSFTVGFKADFAGDISLLDGNDVNAIVNQATMSQMQADSQPVQYVYSQDYDITDPGATGAEVTLSSLDFFEDLYAATNMTNQTIQSSFIGGAGGYSFTTFQLSQSNVILPSLSFEVDANFGGGLEDVGKVTFDEQGNFHFASTGNSTIVPTGANVNTLGMVTLIWNGAPEAAQIVATYDSSDAQIEVLQQTPSGTPTEVAAYVIDPTSTSGQGGETAASPGAALYTESQSDPTAMFAHGGWNTSYTLSYGDPNQQTLSFKVLVGGTVIGTAAADASGNFQFTLVGTPAVVPNSVTIRDNMVLLTWTTNPGSTSIAATYQSVDDRVVNINFAPSAGNANLVPGQYTVEVVTTTPLPTPPTFSETTHYMAPTVSFSGPPSLKADGTITGYFSADSFVPGAGQGGVQGSPSDTKISFYCTPNDSTTGGTLMETVDYGDMIDNGPLSQRSGGFSWTGFQTLPAGTYYIYAVINDGQNPLVDSALTGPYTTTGPKPVLTGPSFLALAPTATASEAGTFSAAAGTALSISMSYATPVTVAITVNSGGGILAPGSTTPTATFTNTYASANQATAALDGLQFIADNTFVNSTTLTLTATTGLIDMNGNPYLATETIPLLTPNTHLVVTQQTSTMVNAVTVTNGGFRYQSTPTVTFTSSDGLGGGAAGYATLFDGIVASVTITKPGIGYDAAPIVSFSGGNPATPASATATIITPPSQPDTSTVTITVSNPGGPDGVDGTNVQIQDYPSAGVTITSATASQGTFDPTTDLWTIGNLPISAANVVTLTLTEMAGPGTIDTPLTNLADGSSAPFAYPAVDSANVVSLAPLSHVVVFNPGTMPAAALGAPYQFTLTADGGGGGPYTFALTGGTLPAGLTLNSNGLLSGTPTGAGGDAMFNVTATSKSGLSTSAAIDLPIANLPAAVVGTAYSQSVGVAAFGVNYQLESGALPAGVTLDFSNGATLTGTPTSAGIYRFVIRENIFVVFGAYMDTLYTLVVDQPLTITTTTLPTATQNTPFSQELTAAGGTGTLLYAVTDGFLPAGLALSANGILSGTPTQETAISTSIGSAFNTNFSVMVTDDVGVAAMEGFSLPVNPAILTGPSPTLNVVVNSPFSEQLTASGGSGSGYSFAVTPGGSLPNGLALTSAGILNGTLPAGTAPGIYSISVRITDGSGGYADAVYQLMIDPAITVTPATLPLVVDGTPYTQALSAAGGSASESASSLGAFAITAGSLPAGLTLSPTGTLSGMVAVGTPAAVYNFTVTATDSFGATGSQAYALQVDPALSIQTMTLNTARQNALYSEAVAATGGSGPIAFNLVAGTLPPGLTLFNNGALAGSIPMSAPPAVYDFTVAATDSLGNADNQFFALNVDPGITLSPSAFPLAFVNAAYSQTLSASGGTAPYNFTLTAGSLPVGLTLSAGGTLSGTISAAATVGTDTFNVTATDAHGNTGVQTYSLAVDRTVSISTPTVAVATVSSPYSQKLTATGGNGNYTFSLMSGNLPAGLALAANGTISGTAASSGTSGNFALTLLATDSLGASAIRTYALHVDPAIAVNPASLPAIAINSPFAVRLTAKGGSGASYTFAVASGQLPTGLTLAKNGLLSGTVHTSATSGVYTFNIKATDSLGGVGMKSYTLTVPLIASISGPTDGFKGVEGEQRTFRIGVVNSNAQLGYTYTINWGDSAAASPDIQVIAATAGNGTGFLVSHTFSQHGVYTVHVTASSPTNQNSAAVALSMPILVAEQQGSAFVVGGTSGADSIVFTPSGAASFQIALNGVSAGTFTPHGTIQIHGDGGNDSVTINGTAGNDLFAVNNLTVSLNNTLFQADAIASWNLNGGTGNDTLMDMSTLPNVPVTFDGGAGTNTLLGPDDPSTWNINAVNAGTVGNVAFRNVQNLLGGAGDDTFLFANAGSVRSINGGAGNNTLDGPNKNNLWAINGANQGTLDAMAFNHIENLVGGTANDLFQFTQVGTVQSLNGGSANGIGDTLDYSAFNSPVTVNLKTGSATNVDNGAAGAVTNIQNVTGGAGNDTLVGNGNNNILNGGNGQNVIEFD